MPSEDAPRGRNVVPRLAQGPLHRLAGGTELPHELADRKLSLRSSDALGLLSGNALGLLSLAPALGLLSGDLGVK